MRGICISKGLILDSKIQQLILDKRLQLLVRTADDYAFVEKYSLTSSMAEESLNQYPLCYCRYIDEPFSTPEEWKPKYDADPKTIIGETFRNIWRIKKSFITLTTYTTLLIFSQLFKWRILHLLYGKRFSMVWIKLGQKNIPDLIKWATEKGKDVWFYSELNKEDLIKELEKL